MFAFKLASSDSELYIGGTNDQLYTGDIEYHDVSSSGQGFWQISGASALVDGKEVVSGFETIIDSGKFVELVHRLHCRTVVLNRL